MSQKQTRSLLLVDDEAQILRVLRRALQQDGVAIRGAQDADRALELMAESPADIIICDHVMPGMSGLELLKHVRVQWPQTMRTLLTGHADMATAIEAINHGEVYRFFTKPWDDSELRLAINQAFEMLELTRENRRLTRLVEQKQSIIERLERQHPGISAITKDARGVIELDD